MLDPTLQMIEMLEEQLALLQKHMSLLKAHETFISIVNASPISRATSKSDSKSDKPKKALDAFGLYVADSMSSSKALHPTKNNKERIAILAGNWSLMPSSEKEKFELRSASLQVARVQSVAASLAKDITSIPTAKETKKRKLNIDVATLSGIKSPVLNSAMAKGKQKVMQHHSSCLRAANCPMSQ